ncbi:MAG: hypothetical protein KDA41_10045 [Planctomycetales bacterium]|nr:hypothetical protein [Planctomycetales bacterium]
MSASAETVQQAISTFQEATALNLRCPHRHGSVVILSPADGQDVMITADLHGNRRNFQRILELAALDESPRRHLIMQEVCHGGPTYPDSVGCMSHLMLEDVARLKVQYAERFHFLLSNHELAELTDFPILKSKRMLNLMFRCGMQEMYGDQVDSVREAAVAFLDSLPVAVRLPGHVLVCHSLPAQTDERGFDAGVFARPLARRDLVEGGDVFRLTWGRDYRQANADAFAEATGDALFITGHEPCPLGHQTPNSRQVILDCCNEIASYALLPLSDQPLTQADVLSHVHSLHGPAAHSNSANGAAR